MQTEDPLPTLTYLLHLYLKHRILRPASVICYENAVRSIGRFSKFKGSSSELKQLTVDHLLEWRGWVLSTCSGTTFNMHRRHIRALLNFAVREGILEKSPLTKVSAAPTGKRRPKTVPVNWLRKTRQLLDQNHPRLAPAWFWRCVFDTMFFGMMRRRQVVELRWCDVHFRSSSITLSAEGSKSRKEWAIPLPKTVIQQIAALKDMTKQILGREVRPNEQVFRWPLFSKNRAQMRHSQMKIEHLSAQFLKLSKLLGYTISAHRVRHTSASVMLARSTDLKGTSEMLGHSSITLTADTYIHPSLSALRKTQKKLPFYAE
jgi:integrase